MTRDELDLIRAIFRNAAFEEIPFLWMQYGEKLLNAAEDSLPPAPPLLVDEEETIFWLGDSQ